MIAQQQKDCVKQRGKERRVDQMLYAYWLSLLGDAHFPSQKDIDPREILQIWDHCFLLELICEDESDECYFQYLGKSLTARGILDQPAYEIYDRLLCVEHVHMRRMLQRMRLNGGPVSMYEQIKSYDGITKLCYRGCLLPLSNDGGRITHAIGGLNWKAI